MTDKANSVDVTKAFEITRLKLAIYRRESMLGCRYGAPAGTTAQIADLKARLVQLQA